MRVLDKRQQYSRRAMLKASGAATFGAAFVVTGGAVTCPQGAWAMEPKALSANSMATLIHMSRDIYPHDRLSDKYYANAVVTFDDKAADDEAFKSMMENGTADLDAAAKLNGADSYLAMGWEKDRVMLLREVEDTEFFQAVRGGLITGLYNNPEVWPLFGYEGESFSKGGYIERGFDDIDWV
jgi:hypothetical protein